MKLFCAIKRNLFSIFQTGLVALLVVMVVVFVVVLWSQEPLWIFELIGLAEREETKHEALKFMGIGMGGVLVALQALMSYKRAKAMEEAAKAQADAVLKTEKGQRQERMKNAIEHLGHESESVRMGGAYELFHLAEDTEALRQTVLDILCAHIRQTTGEDEYREKHNSKPSEEVQSLLTLLFVKNHEIFRGLHINLMESYLNGADIREAHLEKAVLTRAHLQGTIFMEAHLQRANFREAYLQGAYLDIAHMQAAQLFRAGLQGAQLFEAQLQGARLDHACLQGARLGGAHLQGADLFQAKLHGVSCMLGPDTFADRIRDLIGKKTELLNVVFAGGLSREDVDSLVEGLSNEKAKELREKLESHIDKPESNELPPGYNQVCTGAYTEEEAERWIAKYEEAMSEVPKDDS